ncbi:MAG: DUF2726 domain-containing protein [Nitrospinae bacterium]|nr:DUF2726 domain-containing protein [Nitrospinota bacterium]
MENKLKNMTLKKILNLHEEATHIKLKKVCEEYGTFVFPKLRVADVLPIENSGISKEAYRFALQSHFDFVVVNSNHDPLFSVEFDGPSHQSTIQKERDCRKDKLCEQFDFPILRINSKHLIKKYRNFDLLTWFIEVWFLRESFYKAQNDGLVPWDEPFDPMLFMNITGRKENFPMWLSVELRAKIQHLWKSRKCMDCVPSELIGIDKQGNYHGLSWIMIDEKKGVYTQATMQNKNFPIVPSEILGEILVFQLYEELSQVLRNKSKGYDREFIDQMIKNNSEHYEMRLYSGISRNINVT